MENAASVSRELCLNELAPLRDSNENSSDSVQFHFIDQSVNRLHLYTLEREIER